MWSDVTVREIEPKKPEAFRPAPERCVLQRHRCDSRRASESPRPPAQGGPSSERPEVLAARRRWARRRGPFRSGLSLASRCLALTLLLLTALALTPPAQAQDVRKLVGNADQSARDGTYPLRHDVHGLGQSFTTGSNRKAYIGDHIRLSLSSTRDARHIETQAKLYRCASNGLNPGTFLTNMRRNHGLARKNHQWGRKRLLPMA